MEGDDAMMRLLLLTALLVIAGGSVEAYGQGDTRGGRFVRTVWAPMKGNRFRVNSPDVATGRFRDRWEAKKTGKLTLVYNDPRTADYEARPLAGRRRPPVLRSQAGRHKFTGRFFCSTTHHTRERGVATAGRC